jgi:hypothetical protein
VRSDVVDGFILDRGFQVLLTAYPELHRHLDLRALDLRMFEPGALVWRDGEGHVVGDPLRRPKTVVDTATAPIGSVLDKARIALLRMKLVRRDPKMLLRALSVFLLQSSSGSFAHWSAAFNSIHISELRVACSTSSSARLRPATPACRQEEWGKSRASWPRVFPWAACI